MTVTYLEVRTLGEIRALAGRAPGIIFCHAAKFSTHRARPGSNSVPFFVPHTRHLLFACQGKVSAQADTRQLSMPRHDVSGALGTMVMNDNRYALLRIRDVAGLLGISTSTVQRMAADNTLPSCRPTQGTLRFRRTDVEAFIANGCQRILPDPKLSRSSRRH